MEPTALITLCVLVLTLITLIADRFPPAGVVLAATLSLLLADVITTQEAFSGFSNPAPLTVAALFVVAAGAQRTGLLSAPLSRLLGRPGRKGVAHARLLLPTAGASALLNNTPLVAIVIPDVLAWCRRNSRNGSRYLLPLSYAAILGGTLTLLGTSTNLVVSGLLEESGSEPLGIFEVTKIGAPVFVVGMIVLFALSIPLIPNRQAAADQAEDEARAFLVEMRVTGDSSMNGQSVSSAGLRALDGVYLAQLRRDDRSIAPVGPDELLVENDILTFVGQVDNVLDLERMPGLKSVMKDEVSTIAAVDRGLFEVVIGRMSPVAGLTLREADFRARYGAAVVAIHRSGQRLEGKLGDVRLRHGDTLVLVAGDEFQRRYGQSREFLVVAELDAPAPVADAKSGFVGIVIAGFIVLAATGLLSTLEGALLAAGAMVAARVMTFSEAKRSIDLDVILLIASAFGLGSAVRASGLADEIADLFTSAFAGFGTFGVVLGLVLATTILTEVVTNNAAAVVIFPIAVAIAGPAGVDPRLMAMAIAIAASTSFLSPVGYQTNTMVYGPGGYRFADYLRAGLPLSIAVQLTIAATVTLLS